MPVFPVDHPLSVSALCKALGEGVRKGDEAVVISAVCPLDEITANGLSFCRFDGERGRAMLHGVQTGVVVCRAAPADQERSAQAYIEVADPRGWFIDALAKLMAPAPARGIHPTATVEAGAWLEEGVEVGAHALIEAGAVVGAGSEVGAHCVLTSAARLGRNVTVQAHSVVGSTGLSFHKRPDDSEVFFPHLGAAVLEDGVWVGTHSVIVRGILQDTRVGADTRIGNQVNIGHNCQIGPGCFVSSGVVLTGGASLGARTRLAAGVRVNAHCRIGADARVGLGSVVVKSVQAGQKVFGNPARSLPTLGEF